MDDEALRAQLRRHGPRLIHWVTRVPDVQDAAARLAMLEIDRGEVLRANRMTPAGLLEWQITVRPDGRRLFDGCLPTLIEWAGVHPATDMPPSGLTLRSLTLRHPRAAALGEACTAVGLADVAIAPDVHASIDAVLATPRACITSSTMRRALPMVKASKNICDFCPVVPEEVRCSATASSGTDSTSCCLKKLACTGGRATRSSSVASASTCTPCCASSARYQGERCWCQRVRSRMAAMNCASVCASAR